MKRNLMLMAAAVILLYSCTAVSVLASETDRDAHRDMDKELPEITQIVELRKGEELFLPDNGFVQIKDERIACTGSNGNIEALEEGETEVVVRYRIRVKNTVPKEETDSTHSDKNGKENDALDKVGEEEKDAEKGVQGIEGGKSDTEGDESDTEGDKSNAKGDKSDTEESNPDTEEGMSDTKGGKPDTEGGRSDTEVGKGKDMFNIENGKNGSGKEQKTNGQPSLHSMTEIEIPDCRCPVVTLANLKNLSSNNSRVAPCIIVQDENLDKSSVKIRLTGKRTGERNISFQKEENRDGLSLTLDPVTEDDEYILICRASDIYGNQTEQRFLFSVNQSGTSFLFDREESTYSTGFSPEITLDNTDAIQIISCAVNGEPVLYEWEEGKLRIPTEYLKSGKNRITLSVRDTAGNINDMEPWDFIMPLKEDAEADTMPGPEAVKMQKENPAGIIFLLIGSVLVFWEKKMCYNGSMD
ncbi:hypothetical protein PMF13cell1_03387 [Blautia producta]|uniref:Ig-like domain-containing protein n=1 Tax=Blautia producta TaxID=33035 RepID=A0A4P6LYN7_9FIRM|nr:hypothetical protein [Blautia producta]QBE97824.1 hypothetical protein PMF13cell1_03387 [Blautia producta]